MGKVIDKYGDTLEGAIVEFGGKEKHVKTSNYGEYVENGRTYSRVENNTPSWSILQAVLALDFKAKYGSMI